MFQGVYAVNGVFMNTTPEVEALVAKPSIKVLVLLAIVELFALAVVLYLTFSLPGFEMYYQGALILCSVIFLRAYLNYVFTRFIVNPLQITEESGILVRRTRAIPMNRITNFDLIVPIHKRLLRLADLHIDSAGGSEVELKMNNLDFEIAESFKRYISMQLGELRVDAADDGSALQERLISAIDEERRGAQGD
jgi:putative membrane protein